MHPGVRLHVLDVRPILAAGRHPVDDVMVAVDALHDSGVLEIIAPFEPRPLVEKLRGGGCDVETRVMPDGTWSVRIARVRLPPFADLTELEPPEPMEAVLRACAALTPGAVQTARLPRRPVLLFPQLVARGVRFEVAQRPDGTVLLWLQRGPP